MRKGKSLWKLFRENHSGFSLMEVLISIVILVIIAVPLMSNLFESMIMNNKANEIQETNNLAASIMDGIKALNMEETIGQFHGPLGAFQVITAPDGSANAREIAQLEKLPDGSFQVVPTPLTSDGSYYFAIHQIDYEGEYYDALIELDPITYRSIPGTMNDYEMPDIMNLDMNVNEKLFTKVTTKEGTMATLDSEALNTYLQWGRAYAKRLWENSPEYLNYLEDCDRWRDECAKLDEPPYPPAPVPPVFDEEDPRYRIYVKQDIVETYITKSMKITVNDCSIDYRIEYQCKWPGNPSGLDSIISHSVLKRTKSNPIDNIAVFYTPSRFQLYNADKIVLENLHPDGDEIDLYIARQNDGETLGKGIEILRSTDADDISIYIKLNQFEDPAVLNHILVDMVIGGISKGTAGINPKLVKTEIEDRIYDVTVEIFEFVESSNPNDKYKKLICSLKSTREN